MKKIMNNKLPLYVSPAVHGSCAIDSCRDLLASSMAQVFNNGKVVSNSQEVEDLDFSSDGGYWHSWE